MDRVFVAALRFMEETFRRLERQVPPPTEVRFGPGFVLRHSERLIEQAIVQKLARTISALAASRVLLQSGFVQDQAALHRVMDELNEDILFLVAAVTNDKPTDLHKRYLEEFFAEEFHDPRDIVASARSRAMVPRKKIRAYLQRVLNAESADPSRELEVGKTISNVFSGYVHGASPQIMDMCWGNPPTFQLFGMRGTARWEEHRDDAWNYYYRLLISLTAAAKAFGDVELVRRLYSYMEAFEAQTGRIGGARGPAP